MGARRGFADVLTSKLVDVPLHAAPDLPTSRIASPAWVLRLEPLRVASASVLHLRYPQMASAAPAAEGIPMEPESTVTCGGAQACSGTTSTSSPRLAAPRPVVARTARERLALQLLTRLGANLDASSTDEDVRRAYRQLVRESHPDRHQGAAPATIAAHSQRLRAVLRAWDLFQGCGTMAA